MSRSGHTNEGLPHPAPPAGPASARVALTLLALSAALLALHAPAFRLPYLADDYIFLDEARAGLVESLRHAYFVVPVYFRPVGRELYFAFLNVFGHDAPFLGHACNFLLVIATGGAIAACIVRLAGPRAAWLAATAYILLYPHRVAIGYASVAQDLFAALFAACATAFFVRDRRGPAAASFALALLSKESTVLLPLVLLAWRAGRGDGPWPGRVRRAMAATLPLFLVVAVWAVAVPLLRIHRAAGGDTAAMNPLFTTDLGIGPLFKGLRLALLAPLGVEQPPGHLWRALAPAATGGGLAIALCAAAGLLVARIWRETDPRGEDAGHVPDRSAVVWLGALWLILGSFALAPVADRFSGYYVIFSGVGMAMILGALGSRLPNVAIAAAFGLLALVNLAANATGLYRIQPGDDSAPFGSSYTSYGRLRTEADYANALRRALEAHAPSADTPVFLVQPFGFNRMGTAGRRGPQLWLNAPHLNLNFADAYRPGAGFPAPLILRWDPDRVAFAPVPPALFEAIADAERHTAARNDPEALEALMRAMALADTAQHRPERAEILNMLGLARLRLGDTAAAYAAWRRATAEQAHHRGALLNLAALYAGGARFDSAHALTERLLNAHPEDPLGLLYLSRIEMERGNTSAARAAWEALAVRHPALAESLVRARRAPMLWTR